MFLSYGVNLDIIKTRVIEIFSLLSRAAVQGGAPLEKIFEINSIFMKEINTTNNLKDLSYSTLQAVGEFIENVFELSSNKNKNLIRNAINYINDYYRENLTLDTMGELFHINASYFSSLFKSSVGQGFTKYLNEVRIGQAKNLLQETDMPMVDIAFAVGYDSQSYFCKVFKKNAGITPSKYRNL